MSTKRVPRIIVVIEGLIEFPKDDAVKGVRTVLEGFNLPDQDILIHFINEARYWGHQTLGGDWPHIEVRYLIGQEKLAISVVAKLEERFPNTRAIFSQYSCRSSS